MALTTTELAEFARLSKELMNDGGAHWIKGEFLMYDDHDMRTFCSIGAVRQTILGDAEGIAIYDDPRYGRVVQALAAAVREELAAGRYKPANHSTKTRALMTDPSVEYAETVVIDFNDAPGTEWADVERIFNRAEQTLAAA